MTSQDVSSVGTKARKAWTLMPSVALLVRYLLAGLFMWAGGVKLLDPKAFARSIDAFGLVPESLLVVVAIGLPVTEILVALAVVLRWRFGLPLMAGILVLFICVLWYGALSGLDVDCGCFSLAEQTSQSSLWTAFWRDWLMLAAVVFVMIVDKRQRRELSLRDPALNTLT